MHEKKKKWIPTRKTFKIKKKASPINKTPDTVKRPYKHNDTDLWDRGSMNISMSLSLLGTTGYNIFDTWYQVPGRKQGTKENKNKVLTNQVHLYHRY